MGEYLKSKIKERGMSITLFADKIHFSRPNIYHLFSRATIESDTIAKASKVLGVDLMSLYYEKDELPLAFVAEPRAEYGAAIPKEIEKSYIVNIQLNMKDSHHVKVFNMFTEGLIAKFR
jgi:hypothetical protein